MAFKLCVDAIQQNNFANFKKNVNSSALSTKDDQGQTLLHIACTEGRGDVVAHLIKKKKELIHELDTNGWSASHCATTSSNRSSYIETCILLINGGADFSLATKSEGNSPFHYLCRQSIPEELSWTSITGSSTSAFPPGMISQNTEDSFVSILQYAMEKGQGLIYSKNHLGEFPLHFASMKTIVATKFLCDKGAKIDIRSKQGETALHYAVNVGSLNIIQFLLERGANKYITSESDETPLEMAKRLKRTDLVDILADVKLPAIHTSIRNNKWNSVNMFVRAEQSILNNPDKNGLTPVLHAASIANREILLLLLTNNATDATAADKFGNNVFHYLAVSMLMKKRATNEVKPSTLSDAEFLKTVLSRAGAPTLNKANKLGETPLHNAALHGNVPLCKFLLENGASISAQNDLGETPLHYAVIGQKIDIIKLIALDANLELIPNKKSETAFDFATKLRVEEALTILTPIHQAANDPKRKKKEKEDKKQKEKQQEKENKEKEKQQEKEKQEKEKQEKEKTKSPNEPESRRKDKERKQTKIFGNLKGLDISGPSQVVHAVHVNKELTWESNDPEEVFELERQVGSGAFGVVYRARHKATGIILAVKSLPAGDHPEEIRNEIAILQKCNDPNIVSYLGSMLKEPKLWILMEFCGCGSVSDLIKKMKEKESRLTEGQVASICIAVVKGLMYLHSQKFIHRDLKPANILLNGSGEAKIADFGVSAQLSHTIQQANTTIGTPLYMSPESISGNKYDNKTDIWSLGITVIEMIECKLPFEGMNIMQAIGAIVNDPPPTLVNPGKYSAELNNFISECLMKDPAKRKSAFELLMHPFISNRLGQDQKQVLKELLREFYDVTSVDSSAVFNSTPKERTSSTLDIKGKATHAITATTSAPPAIPVTTIPVTTAIKNERVEVVKSGESFLGSHKRFSSDSKVSSNLDDEEVLEEESPLSSPHLTAGKDDSLVETLRETVFDLKAQLEAERTKTMVFPKPSEPSSEVDRLQKELSESKAIQSKQLQEIETLKQQLASVTKSRDLLEETVKKLITQVSNLEAKLDK